MEVIGKNIGSIKSTSIVNDFREYLTVLTDVGFLICFTIQTCPFRFHHVAPSVSRFGAAFQIEVVDFSSQARPCLVDANFGFNGTQMKKMVDTGEL